MRITLIILGLFCGTVIQAYPSWEPNPDENEEDYHLSHSGSSLSDLVHPKNKKECEKKLDWFKNGTEKAQKVYDLVNSKIQMLNATGFDAHRLKSHHDKLEHHMTEQLEKYGENRNKVLSISNSTALLISCGEQIEWRYLWHHNLSEIASNVKTDILQIAHGLGVPKDVVGDLDKALARVVNFLFIMDMTKNTFKDLSSLLKKSDAKTEDEAALKKRKEAGERVGKAKTKGEEGKGDTKAETEGEDFVDYDVNALNDNNEMDNELDTIMYDLENDEVIQNSKKRADERIIQQQETEIESNNKIDKGYEAENYFGGRRG